MKVSEFEARLGTVSDDKLRQMLSASRANGPEVAVQLILAEGRKRGMADLEGPESGAEATSATSAYPRAQAGLDGADAPPAPTEEASEPMAEGEAKPVPPEWLSEETKSGMPMTVKILLLLLVVGVILALAWKFSH
jgi:hypothetical protein